MIKFSGIQNKLRNLIKGTMKVLTSLGFKVEKQGAGLSPTLLHIA
jgi:hypothetical protein